MGLASFGATSGLGFSDSGAKRVLEDGGFDSRVCTRKVS